ncbi:hypothetical protein CYMTET_44820, partial [Cymbomonas tetramitiformis]
MSGLKSATDLPMVHSVDSFVREQLELVDLERTAEEQQTAEQQAQCSFRQLEQSGVAILSLTVAERKTGLGGRMLLTMEKCRGGVTGPLPAHRLSSGDIVALRDTSSPALQQDGAASDERGLVYRVSEAQIIVAIEDPDRADDIQGTVHLLRLANDITYKRYRHILHQVDECAPGHATSRLKDVLFGQAEPHFRAPVKIHPMNPNLNSSQVEAIEFALSASDVALIHGPPGTGKTTTIVELIRQAVKRGDKVLACAPSNVAVDNMAERLANGGVKIVRLGHPVRLLDSVTQHSLDVQVQNSDGKGLAKDVRQDMNAILQKMGCKKTKKQERYALRGELKELRKELRKREDQAVKEVMGHARVVLATNTGAADYALKHMEAAFDLVVIDEAAQALEVSCWIPMLRGRRVVLAGDHKQLAPTITSAEAAKRGLGLTLFDRVVGMYGASCTRMLNVQYRMNQEIR